MEKEIESIFKVIRYEPTFRNKQRLRYPTFRVSGNNVIYFRTLEDVENYMQERGGFYNSVLKMHPIDGNYIDLYAYVVIEIPLREEINVDVLDQNLSLRIYLPDGTLWGKNDYGSFMSKDAIGDEYNY